MDNATLVEQNKDLQVKLEQEQIKVEQLYNDAEAMRDIL